MYKKIVGMLAILLFSIMLAACSGDEATPKERMDAYADQWNKQQFSEMYAMLTKNAKKQYAQKDFADRYKKIYGDLEIKDLKVKYNTPDDKKLKTQMKKDKVVFPVTVKMNSIAGPIEFNTKATLKREENQDKKTNWYVDWNPGLIFPELANGGSIEIQTEEAQRGEILDRNQMPLAINDTAYRIGIVPEQFGEDASKKSRLASLLGMSEKQIDDALSQSWVKPNLFVPLKVLQKTEESAIAELSQMSGVSYEETKSRVYPAGKAASHLIGYIGKITNEELKEKGDGYTANDIIGKRGLEKQLEDRLRGQNGTKIVVKNPDETESVIAERPKKDGKNIKLTIDVNLQEDIFNSYNGDAGTAAAVDPKTGETLALISSPGFDPALFVNGISQNQLTALENDPKKPLINRFSLTYAPGSAQKTITAAIGLENGTIQPNKGVTINGLEWSGGKGWGDYKVRRVSSSDKPVDLEDALIRSDNIYFAQKAVKMGAAKYEDGLKKFGFAEDLPFAYPIKKSQISNSGKFDNEVLLANSSYGQGELEASSLHLALAYTAVLNEGKMVKPVLLQTEEKGKTWHDGLVSKENAKILQDALRKVVTAPNGTAKAAKDSKVAISGKTSTAELKSSADEDGKENSWFVAYPTKDKDLVISMLIEDTKGRGHVAVERMADIMTAWKK